MTSHRVFWRSCKTPRRPGLFDGVLLIELMKLALENQWKRGKETWLYTRTAIILGANAEGSLPFKPLLLEIHAARTITDATGTCVICQSYSRHDIVHELRWIQMESSGESIALRDRSGFASLRPVGQGPKWPSHHLG